MDKWFDESFKKFYIKLTVYNFTKMKNMQLKPEYQKLEKCMKVMLPIFDRLMENDNITIDNINHIPQQNESSTLSTVPIVNVDTETNDNEYLFVNTSNTIKQSDDDSDNEVDEEGDKQVEEITSKSLELLKKIRANGWIYVESDDGYDDLDSDDEETTDGYISEHSNEDSNNVFGSNDSNDIDLYKDSDRDLYMNNEAMSMYS